VAAAAVSPGSSDGMSAMTQAEMMNCIGNGGMVRNGGGGARKRDSPEDGCTEKTVERRQRRMIKNRESAARSRARKQVCMLFSSISCSLCVIDRLDVL
jgi:ABA responsive element binding factor